MTSEVRLAEQIQSGHSARFWELSPQRLADNLQFEFSNGTFTNGSYRLQQPQPIARTTARINDPLAAGSFMGVLRLRHFEFDWRRHHAAYFAARRVSLRPSLARPKTDASIEATANAR